MTNEFRNLSPADVIIAKKRKGSALFNHYIVYVNENRFLINMSGGVKSLLRKDVGDLLEDYKPIRIRKFVGTSIERQIAVNRGLSKIGTPYNIFTYNCEHFANWVQKGINYSNQSLIAFRLLLILGLSLICYSASKNLNQ